MIEALLCVFVFWAVNALNVWFYGHRACEALVISTLTGLVLGDVKTGIIMGGLLQTVFLGVVDIGGSIPSDQQIGSIIPTALVIQTGTDYSSAIAIAYVVGTLSAQIWAMWYPMLSVFDMYFNKLIDKGEGKTFARMHMLFGITIQLLPKYIIVFLALSVGTDAFQAMLNSIPTAVMTGLSAAGNMVVAVGIGLIVNLIWKTEIGAFFFVGFLLAGAVGLNTIQIALVGVAIAVLYYSLLNNKNSSPELSIVGEVDDGGDFFS